MAMIFDSQNRFYKSNFGAVAQDTEVEFSVLLPKDIGATYVGLVVERDDFPNFYAELVRCDEQDGCFIYSGKYIFDVIGLAWYYFKVVTDNGEFFVVKNSDNSSIGVISNNIAQKFQQTVYDKNLSTPDRFKGGIMYQIFPDRFFQSESDKADVPSDRILRSDWGGVPHFLPNEDGKILNNDYFCGNLKGIEQKLDYLTSLGVDCIYLNPIFEAHSNHRYDTADYMKIDPLLGRDEDFCSLCKKAHEKGIAIILDGVFSHTGSDSIYFNKNHRYPDIGAYDSPDSRYYSWFNFTHYPEKYSAWWGIVTMPETNEDDPNFREFICGKHGVIRHWLKLGADGFRLDVADELTDGIIDDIRITIKSEGKENILIGEVWENASNKESYGNLRRYLLGNQLDSVMNYPFKEAILDFLGDKNINAFSAKIMTILENYPKPILDVLMNSISTHDTLRAITRLAGESCEGKDRTWQSEHYLDVDGYIFGKKLLKLAMVLQFMLPGIPCIYYGDEVGMQGYKDPFNRGCFPWGQEDNDMLCFVRGLSAIRKKFPCLKAGELEFLDVRGLLVFRRYDSTGSVTVAINVSDTSNEFCGKPIDYYGYLII